MCHREIVICDSCKGEGYRIHQTMTNYHRGEYDEKRYECPRCKGKGRLVKETTVQYKELT